MFPVFSSFDELSSVDFSIPFFFLFHLIHLIHLILMERHRRADAAVNQTTPRYFQSASRESTRICRQRLAEAVLYRQRHLWSAGEKYQNPQNPPGLNRPSPEGAAISAPAHQGEREGGERGREVKATGDIGALFSTSLWRGFHPSIASFSSYSSPIWRPYG